MSKSIVADIFTVGIGGPEIHEGAADPSAGGGVPAPVGSIYLRTDGTWWRKVGAPNTAWVNSSSTASAAQRFTYTVGVADGSDFFVTLPAARANDLYEIFSAQGDVALIVGMQFPNAQPNDRTTTQFHVVTTAAMTAGDTIMFYIDDPV